MTEQEHPMLMSLEEFIDMIKPLAMRLGFDLERSHPVDLVSTVVPLLEAWAAGFGEGFNRGRSSR